MAKNAELVLNDEFVTYQVLEEGIIHNFFHYFPDTRSQGDGSVLIGVCAFAFILVNGNNSSQFPLCQNNSF
jgi:hypothetical protein